MQKFDEEKNQNVFWNPHICTPNILYHGNVQTWSCKYSHFEKILEDTYQNRKVSQYRQNWFSYKYKNCDNEIDINREQILAEHF